MGGAAQLLSPAKRRRAFEHVRGVLGQEIISERRACRVIGQSRNTRQRKRHVPDDEPRLVKRIAWLACAYGRYGYRRITVLLRWDGWRVNHKRVQRIWRDQGLTVPQKQPKRKRLWINDGSCIRPRRTQRNRVWSFRLAARGRSRFVGDDVLADQPPITVEPHGPYPTGAVRSRLNTSMSRSR